MNLEQIEALTLICLVISLAGLVVNLYTLKDGKKDRYVAQHHIHKGTRLHVANTNIRRERVRAFVQSLLFVVALVFLENPPTEELIDARAWVVITVTLASVAQASNSIVDAKDRRELLELIDKQQGLTEHQVRNKVFKEQIEAEIRKKREERGETH